MAQTVFITGTLSGIGRETAKYFWEKGWNVVATMRNPKTEKDFQNFPRMLLLRVDVTKPQSIQKAAEATVKKFGAIDVVVNNAGIGIEGPFESFHIGEVREIFETNFFGVLNTIYTVLPVMKKQKSGVIINISSMGGRLTFPYYTTYHASKWAIEGFSESLQYELVPLGITVKLIEPGIIQTDFFRKMDIKSKKNHDQEYLNGFEKLKKRKSSARKHGSHPKVVAKRVYQAATDGSSRLRYIVGLDAYAQIMLSKFLPEQWIYWMIKLLTQ